MNHRQRSTWSLCLATLACSACGQGGVEPLAPDLASVGGPPVQPIPWVDICHLNPDGVVTARAVPQMALANHLAHGDVRYAVTIPAGAAFSASAWIAGNPAFAPDRTPQRAFDGDDTIGWNAGDWPLQWIEVDFGSPQTFRRIAARVDQTPATGATVHEVSVDNVLVRTWSGTTSLGEWLDHDLGAQVSAQRVRITTTASPSWVAWYEIRFLRC